MSPAPAKRPARPAPGSSRRTTSSGPAASKASPKASSKRLPIALIVGVALAIGLVAVIVITMGSSKTTEVGTPTVTGTALPDFVELPADDPAIGLPIPEVTGKDFDGNAVSIARDGRPKLLIFVAHWCAVCRREVPAITAWLPTASLPENLDLVSISTGVDAGRENYPPSRWLERDGWTVPVIMDDAAGGVGAAYGLKFYPYFVFVDAQGNVALRLVGEESTATIAAAIAEIAGT